MCSSHGSRGRRVHPELRVSGRWGRVGRARGCVLSERVGRFGTKGIPYAHPRGGRFGTKGIPYPHPRGVRFGTKGIAYAHPRGPLVHSATLVACSPMFASGIPFAPSLPPCLRSLY